MPEAYITDNNQLYQRVRTALAVNFFDQQKILTWPALLEYLKGRFPETDFDVPTLKSLRNQVSSELLRSADGSPLSEPEIAVLTMLSGLKSDSTLITNDEIFKKLNSKASSLFNAKFLSTLSKSDISAIRQHASEALQRIRDIAKGVDSISVPAPNVPTLNVELQRPQELPGPPAQPKPLDKHTETIPGAVYDKGWEPPGGIVPSEKIRGIRKSGSRKKEGEDEDTKYEIKRAQRLAKFSGITALLAPDLIANNYWTTLQVPGAQNIVTTLAIEHRDIIPHRETIEGQINDIFDVVQKDDVAFSVLKYLVEKQKKQGFAQGLIELSPQEIIDDIKNTREINANLAQVESAQAAFVKITAIINKDISKEKQEPTEDWHLSILTKSELFKRFYKTSDAQEKALKRIKIIVNALNTDSELYLEDFTSIQDFMIQLKESVPELSTTQNALLRRDIDAIKSHPTFASSLPPIKGLKGHSL